LLLLRPARLETADGLAPALHRLTERKVQALIVPLNGLLQNEAPRIVQLATSARLPTIFADRRSVELGGLASYGIDEKENFRRAADYVDRILKGAKPAEMPIEFPTKIELVINLKTAKGLALDVPLHIQQRADALRSYAENDAQRPLSEIKADSHVAVR
jgi:putative ABC transport system substrate-binding protein